MRLMAGSGGGCQDGGSAKRGAPTPRLLRCRRADSGRPGLMDGCLMPQPAVRMARLPGCLPKAPAGMRIHCARQTAEAAGRAG